MSVTMAIEVVNESMTPNERMKCQILLIFPRKKQLPAKRIAHATINRRGPYLSPNHPPVRKNPAIATPIIPTLHPNGPSESFKIGTITPAAKLMELSTIWTTASMATIAQA